MIFVFIAGAIANTRITVNKKPKVIHNELSLIYAVYFKNECNEYIAETYSDNNSDSLKQCIIDGNTLSNNNNGVVWACIDSKDHVSKYTPKQSVE